MPPETMTTVRLLGETHELRPGDIIGRSVEASLTVEDAAVSEMHAYVTVREDALVLLPLRGSLTLHGMPVESVLLEPGLRIGLSTRSELEVLHATCGRHPPSMAATEDGSAVVLRARYDVVEIERRHRPVAVISGTSARIVCELAELKVPVHWEVVAGEVWRKESDRHRLRRRWDKALARLRSALDDEELGGLVYTDHGRVGLILRPGDRVVVGGPT